MNSFQLKIVAITAMVIDHIGLFFFPQFWLLRIIGRLAFPLFAWFIANGAYHTHDIKKYAERLFIFALISQIPFALANMQIGLSFWQLNVLFTLFLGLVAIIIIKKTSHIFIRVIGIILCALLASIISADYGAAGVLSIVAFYVYFNNLLYMFLAQGIILFLTPLYVLLIEHILHINLSVFYLDAPVEIFGLISLIFISLYNKKRGTQSKYLFYYFYPLHYIAIILIGLFI